MHVSRGGLEAPRSPSTHSRDVAASKGCMEEKAVVRSSAAASSGAAAGPHQARLVTSPPPSRAQSWAGWAETTVELSACRGRGALQPPNESLGVGDWDWGGGVLCRCFLRCVA